MSNLPATLRQEAVSLRDYLGSKDIMPQISSALPKWLSPDRFFRVVFGAILRNPKLVECTRESILQSVMFCAQLGVEPILGRAYLIPYENSKYVNGEWVKIPECQAQIGYQGLVDLARRSDTIADVWGANVYENDIFDLSYGMERGLIHKPWFMDRVLRAEGKPGECLGAYVVWQLKDGTKHPEFMPIYEIHKRRAKSQSYTWAETGEPKKGGGKRNSVWHEWPEEMNLKTVIKHSAKLVPASIEFMQAVQLDDEHDFLATAPLALPDRLPAPDPDPRPSFDAIFADEIKDPLFSTYLAECAKLYQLSDDQIRTEFCNNPAIKRLFANWKKNVEAKAAAQAKATPATAPAAEVKAPEKQAEDRPAEAPAPEVQPQPAEPVEAPKEKSFRDEWINLTGKGYGPYVQRNLERFAAADIIIRQEAEAKWKKLYANYPCPIHAPAIETPKVEQQQLDIDPVLDELRSLNNDPHQKYFVLQAQKNLGFGINTIPLTTDGRSRLLDEVNRLIEERQKNE